MWIATSCLLSLGCPADDPPPPVADTTGGEDSGTSTSGNVSMTSMGSLDSADTTAGGVSTGMADGSFLDPSTDEGPGPMPQPNGGMCDGADGCVSGFCYDIPMLGGICSECLTDTDCDAGTCSLDLMLGYAVCTDGSLGVMCSTDEGCMGDLICAELINTGGIFPADFCSECRDDTPCAGEQICTPVYDIVNIAGYQGCVDPASVPNGGGCPLDGVMGDGAVCQSGQCGTATLFGLVPVGVCGECLTDMDCEGMGLTTCQEATADMMGLMGATCI